MGVEHLVDAGLAGLSATPLVRANSGYGGRVRHTAGRIVTTSADSAGSTYTLARVPSSARPCNISKLFWDDLATTGSPTLDIGIFPVPELPDAFTGVAAALNDGLDAAGSGTPNEAPLVKNFPANGDKMLWEYLSTVTKDPQTDVLIKVTLADAAITTAGDVCLDLYYKNG